MLNLGGQAYLCKTTQLPEQMLRKASGQQIGPPPPKETFNHLPGTPPDTKMESSKQPGVDRALGVGEFHEFKPHTPPPQGTKKKKKKKKKRKKKHKKKRGVGVSIVGGLGGQG